MMPPAWGGAEEAPSLRCSVGGCGGFCFGGSRVARLRIVRIRGKNSGAVLQKDARRAIDNAESDRFAVYIGVQMRVMLPALYPVVQEKSIQYLSFIRNYY